MNSKKEQLLSAAIKTFACTGYAASTVPEIAKLAHVSIGTLYHYFDSKQDLLNEALQLILKHVNDNLASIIHSNRETEVLFNDLLGFGFQFIQEDITTIHFLYENIYNDKLYQPSITLREQTVDLLNEFFKNGEKQNVFKTSDIHAQLAISVGSLFMMCNFYWISQNFSSDNAPNQQSLEDLKTQIWHGLTI